MKDFFRYWRAVAIMALNFAIQAQGATNSLPAGFNDLGFELLRRATAAKPNENALISPASLGFTLALLEQATSPEAEKELNAILHIAGIDKTQLAGASRALRQSIVANAKNPGLQIDVAQSIWIDRRIQVGAAFLHIAQTAFDSEIKPCDFSNPATAADMNAWAAAKTHGKITSVFFPGSEQGMPTVLLNAVYFHDAWAQPFPAHLTHPANFNGKFQTTQPDFMAHELKSGYANYGGIDHVSLAYRNGAFIMDLILPRNATDLEKWIKNAKSDRFAAGASRLKSELLDLKLPKFEFSRENPLLDDLQKMGAKHLVEPGALPGIAAETYLSYLAQKTYIRVDEEGTEAAAITEAVAMTLGIHEPPKTKTVIFDRPFFFAIRHRQSGALLFLGTIWNLPNPAAKQNGRS